MMSTGDSLLVLMRTLAMDEKVKLVDTCCGIVLMLLSQCQRKHEMARWTIWSKSYQGDKWTVISFLVHYRADRGSVIGNSTFYRWRYKSFALHYGIGMRTRTFVFRCCNIVSVLFFRKEQEFISSTVNKNGSGFSSVEPFEPTKCKVQVYLSF